MYCFSSVLAQIPYRASEQDVLRLFRKFGKVINLYMVKDKLDGSRHKGCAFLSYGDKSTADRAIKEIDNKVGEITLMFRAMHVVSRTQTITYAITCAHHVVICTAACTVTCTVKHKQQVIIELIHWQLLSFTVAHYGAGHAGESHSFEWPSPRRPIC